MTADAAWRLASTVVASPPGLLTCSLLLYVLALRSRLLGGLAFLAVGLLAVAAGIAEPTLGRALLADSALPVVAIAALGGAMVWTASHRRSARGTAVAAPGALAGPPWLWYAAAGAGLVACALLLPVALGPPADPLLAPDPSRLPWFLTGFQELAATSEGWLPALAVPALLLAGLFALPWLDGVEPGGQAVGGRRLATLFPLAGLVLWLEPTVVATFLRGAGWQAVAPLDPGMAPPSGVPPLPLSTRIWDGVLGVGPPASPVVRELPGLLLLGVLCVWLPARLPAWRLTGGAVTRLRAALGTPRYAALVILVSLCVLLPLKTYLRWLGVASLVSFPEISVSF